MHASIPSKKKIFSIKEKKKKKKKEKKKKREEKERKRRRLRNKREEKRRGVYLDYRGNGRKESFVLCSRINLPH